MHRERVLRKISSNFGQIACEKNEQKVGVMSSKISNFCANAATNFGICAAVRKLSKNVATK